jgi:hypothetical protein
MTRADSNCQRARIFAKKRAPSRGPFEEKGRVPVIALPPTLRTTARLAGAGMDRVAHGLYVDNLKPLELAARAKLAIAFAGPGSTTESLVSLLGT